MRQCPFKKCEEMVWADQDELDRKIVVCTKCPAGHEFCWHCANGPHIGKTCVERKAEIEHAGKISGGKGKGACSGGGSASSKNPFAPNTRGCPKQNNVAPQIPQTEEALKVAQALGFRPCPKLCMFGGGYKNFEECDHVACKCGFEFCWSCG